MLVVAEDCWHKLQEHPFIWLESMVPPLSLYFDHFKFTYPALQLLYRSSDPAEHPGGFFLQGAACGRCSGSPGEQLQPLHVMRSSGILPCQAWRTSKIPRNQSCSNAVRSQKGRVPNPMKTHVCLACSIEKLSVQRAATPATQTKIMWVQAVGD